ncbi:RTA1-domain-containing protein [Ceratobasidium sp. AG-I]|nr:RTA1-domain-containing protein [Ceratobasidium sp. AG-I]
MSCNRTFSPSLSSFLFGLLFYSSYALAQTDNTTDDAEAGQSAHNPMHYIPSKTIAVIAGSVYMLTVGIYLIRSMRRWGRYMLTIIICGMCYAAGLYIRIWFANNTTLKVYIILNMLTILSPCGFIATVYMLLGRLAVHLQAGNLLVVRPSIITKLFVTSDLVTLLVQAGGGGMQSAQDAKMADLGAKMFLYGLIIQLVSFIIYCLIFALFVYRLKTQRAKEWYYRPNGLFGHWLALIYALTISCIGIVVRSVFRTIENAQGFDGTLATTESYFYVLDCVPLWIAIVVFAVVWPPVYLTAQETRTELYDEAVRLQSYTPKP